jgi:hypothetical protein
MKICALLLSLLLTLAGSPAWAEAEYAPVPDRYSEIDARIEALDAERAGISMKGPKTATILGLGIIVAGGITMAAGAAAYGGSEDDQDEAELLGTFFAGAALLGIGAISSIAGGIVWSKRTSRRDEIDAERESLIKERDGLAATLSRLELHSPYRNGTQFVTLGVRF